MFRWQPIPYYHNYVTRASAVSLATSILWHVCYTCAVPLAASTLQRHLCSTCAVLLATSTLQRHLCSTCAVPLATSTLQRHLCSTCATSLATSHPITLTLSQSKGENPARLEFHDKQLAPKWTWKQLSLSLSLSHQFSPTPPLKHAIESFCFLFVCFVCFSSQGQ